MRTNQTDNNLFLIADSNFFSTGHEMKHATYLKTQFCDKNTCIHRLESNLEHGEDISIDYYYLDAIKNDEISDSHKPKCKSYFLTVQFLTHF